MTTNGNWGWFICCGLAVVTMVLAFTPVFLPAGVSTPEFRGIPYALWSGVALCLWMVILTAVGTVVHPGGQRLPAGEQPNKD